MAEKYAQGKYTPKPTAFSKSLDNLITKLGLTEREVCKKMGIGQSYVHMLRAGQRAPKTGDSDALKRWAKALDLEGEAADRFVAMGIDASLPGDSGVELDLLRRQNERLERENAKLRAELEAAKRATKG